MRRAGYLHLSGPNLVFDRVGKGPPVLLVAEEASRWPEALPEGYAFYLLDLPGYGRTEGPRMAPEELAHFVAGFVVMMNLGAPWVLLRGLGLALGPHLEALGLRALPAEGVEVAAVLSSKLSYGNIDLGGNL